MTTFQLHPDLADVSLSLLSPLFASTFDEITPISQPLALSWKSISSEEFLSSISSSTHQGQYPPSFYIYEHSMGFQVIQKVPLPSTFTLSTHFEENKSNSCREISYYFIWSIFWVLFSSLHFYSLKVWDLTFSLWKLSLL